MRVFVTGATGFIGSAVVEELIRTGHQVLGLARSNESAKKLTNAGAEVQTGSLEDVESLKSGAAACGGVIHTGFVHDFSNFKAVCEIDRRAIEAMGDVLKGTDKPLIITSGIALVNPGNVATENDRSALTVDQNPRVGSEIAAQTLADSGVHTAIVRLAPSVHGDKDHHGFIPTIIKIAREKGVSAYIGEGQNRWTAVHYLDAAHLFVLALEKATAGARYHGVADGGITTKEIAEIIGRQLNLPVVSKSKEEAGEHFGWMAHFLGLDCPASSTITQQQLGWKPEHPGLIADLEQGMYFKN